MPTSIKKVTQEILQLSKDQRLSLAHQLLSSIEPASDSGTEAAWDLEIRKRIRQYDARKAVVISAAKVFKDLDKQLGR